MQTRRIPKDDENLQEVNPPRKKTNITESDKLSPTSDLQQMPEDTMQSTQLADMEMRLERSLTTNLTASLTTSLTTSISTNLQSIIDKSLNDALEKMTSKMSELIALDPTIKKQQSDVSFLKYENSRLTKQVSILEME